MGKSIKDIANIMKEEFMLNPDLQDKYGFNPDKTFDEQFSSVSIEAIWIYIMAVCAWMNGKEFEAFRAEVDALAESRYVTSLLWYQTKALEFQLGDNLVFNDKTYSFHYSQLDESKKVVRNVAVREVEDNGVTKLKIYFSDMNKMPITGDARTAFENYMRTIGAAGTHYLFVSEPSDALRVHLHVYYDPLVLDSTGKRLSGDGKPVEETINNYLNSLEYAGAFYSSKLVDMLQMTEGVKDVTLDAVTWNNSREYRRKIDSLSGAFVLDGVQEEDIVYSID